MEYKPFYKLLVFNLQAGLLQADKEFINIPKDVINQIIILTDLKDKFVYYFKWLTAVTLT
jgi:hypothetical protein